MSAVGLNGVSEALFSMGALLLLGGRQLWFSRRAVVYVPTSEIPWVTLPAAFLSWIFRRRLVLANLNTRIDLARGVVGRILWRIHARADRVIALSAAIASELKVLGISANVEINSVGYERPRKLPARDAPRHSAIYVGRLEPAKGFDDLLNTWSEVVRRRPTADLITVGYATPANLSRFKDARQALGLNESVQYLGVVSDDEKWRLLRDSRACVFLSRVEGWGFVPLEALSLGVPAIVYDLPCYRESLKGLEGVVTIEVGNTLGAAQHIVRLLDLNRDDYMALSSRLSNSFSYRGWREVAERELDLIRGRASSPGARPEPT